MVLLFWPMALGACGRVVVDLVALASVVESPYTPAKTVKGCREIRASSQQSEALNDGAIVNRTANPKLKATIAC